jgi:hypothetical protein
MHLRFLLSDLVSIFFLNNKPIYSLFETKETWSPSYIQFEYLNFKNKFLTIKAKYNVIEPHYMEGTTPDQLPSYVAEP